MGKLNYKEESRKRTVYRIKIRDARKINLYDSFLTYKLQKTKNTDGITAFARARNYITLHHGKSQQDTF